MERIRVLHREFAHPYESAPRSAFVAEFGLYLIDHERQLLIAVNRVARKLYRRFLVSHAENVISAVTVLKPHHFVAYRRISSGFFPHLARHNHGEHALLPFHRVHLLADNVLYLTGYPFRRHRKRPDTVGYKLHITRSYHQRVAFYHGVGRRGLGAFADKFRHQHIYASVTSITTVVVQSEYLTGKLYSPASVNLPPASSLSTLRS